jgi:hypothetical protein
MVNFGMVSLAALLLVCLIQAPLVEGRVRRLGDDEGVRHLKKDKKTTPKVPTFKAKKTKAPTRIPSRSPLLEPTETFEPSSDPSAEPSISVMPSAFPSDEPSISLEPSTTFAPTSSKKKKSSKSGKGKGGSKTMKVNALFVNPGR